MTGYIFRIDSTQPEHWDFARKEGYWDFNVKHQIKRGDPCYFFMNDGVVLGRAIAKGAGRDVPSGDPGPWGGQRAYKFRVDLCDFEDLSDHQVAEGDLRQARGNSLNPRSSSILSPTQLAAVELLFMRADEEVETDDADETRRRWLEEMGWDLRRFDMRCIRLRQGQPAFRSALLRAYGERCAVTGSATMEVLEAAHISPYLGSHTNFVTNGLLLRSDIHTLFDLHRLTILPDLTVSLHPRLRRGDYQELHGSPFRVMPLDLTLQPDLDLLRQHNELCRPWLQS